MTVGMEKCPRSFLRVVVMPVFFIGGEGATV